MTIKTYEHLRESLVEAHPIMPGRLRQMAEYALAHPDDMALETIAVLSERSGVSPSGMVRFAQALGFSGFSEMQKIFREGLLHHMPDYRARIRAARRTSTDKGIPQLQSLVEAGIASLQHLGESEALRQLDTAVNLLDEAERIHVAAQRRSFPVAAYLAYALGHLGRPAHLLDGVGGMFGEQARNIQENDALLAISFPPYAPEVVQVVKDVAARGVAVIVLTDSPVSPIHASAKVAFEVLEMEVSGFRSLSASMCLALGLVVTLGERLEREGNGP